MAIFAQAFSGVFGHACAGVRPHRGQIARVAVRMRGRVRPVGHAYAGVRPDLTLMARAYARPAVPCTPCLPPRAPPPLLEARARAYAGLGQASEPVVATLMTVHNLHHMNTAMARTRQGILDGRI